MLGWFWRRSRPDQHVILVPTLCVGTVDFDALRRVRKGCGPMAGWEQDAERPGKGSHAERGNQEKPSADFWERIERIGSLMA